MAAWLAAHRAWGAQAALGPTCLERSLAHLVFVRRGRQPAFEVAAQGKAWRPNHQGWLAGWLPVEPEVPGQLLDLHFWKVYIHTWYGSR